MSQWYYSHKGQQKGPVPISELIRLSTNGEFDLDKDLVWREGMADWQPGSSISELAPRSAATAASVPSMPDGPLNPYAAPSNVWKETPGGPVDLPKVLPANYPLFAGLTAIGAIGFGIGFGVFVAQTAADGAQPENIPAAGLVVIGVSAIPLIIGSVLGLIYLHRAWQLLQPYTRYSTPGKAVGFLFIPFFNFYWHFVAYWRWSQEWNRLVASSPQHANAPRASEGLFLAYAILQLAALLVGAFASIPLFVIYFIIMKSVCDAVNYAARS